MGQYIVVSERTGSATSGSKSAALQTEAKDHGFVIQSLGPKIWLGVLGPRPPKALTVGPWILLGDILNRANRRLDPLSDLEPYSYEKKLVSRFWGRFVGVRLRGSELDAVLRDPSGAVDCVTWHDNDLIVVASDIPAWLTPTLPKGSRIDFASVGQALRDPLRVWNELLLEGPRTVLPGTLLELPAEGSCAPLWRPDAFVRRSDRGRLATDDAATLVRRAVDETVAGMASLSPDLGCEVSGGLDSSVVAASLVASDSHRVRLWLNAYGDDAGADERVYVNDLASRLGIVPKHVRRAEGSVTEDGLLRISQGMRPGLNALDWHYDDAWAEQWQAAGVRAVMTGKGGDSVLIQAVTADVFTDQFRAQGWRSILSPDLPRLARLNQRSVWALVAEARSAKAVDGPPPGPEWSTMERAPSGPQSRHPWLEGIEPLGPAKTHQIAGMASGVSFSAPSSQTAVVDVFHPLLAQPVVEAALSLSAQQLTAGVRDRGLIRHAFADRLPRSILDRQSKGDWTAFYGRMLADSLDVLRPWLLEGRLAAEGLLNAAVLEQALTRETLLWRGGYGEIMIAAALEGWVRVWEARLSPFAKRPAT